MKGSKKAKNNNANSMNEAQLESVQGGTGGTPMTLEERGDMALYGRKIPAGWNPSDGARGKQKQPRGFGAGIPTTLEEMYRRNE